MFKLKTKKIQLEFMEKVVIKFALIFSFIFSCLNGFSQSQTDFPPLERIMSIDLSGSSSKDALKLMEEQGKFGFAYKTDVVSSTNSMTRSYNNKTTREILDDLFQGEVSYKSKGNYIVLRSSPKLKEQEISIEGYIINALTDEKISYATIFDTSSLNSAITDEFGHYSLKMIKKDIVYLNVKKNGFKDTIIHLSSTGNNILNVKIIPEVLPVKDSVDTNTFLSKLKNMKLLNLSKEQKESMLNFKKNLSTKVQFSILPSIGTNGLLNTSTTVDYSFNLLGGLNAGVRKAEFGAFLNMNIDSVKYFQAAGFMNIVGGHQEGIQCAGFSNLNNASFEGAQLAGFSNTVRKDFKGLQGAGFINSTLGKHEGVQGAGFTNIAGKNSNTIQLAGFSNQVLGNSKGLQIAGFSNTAGNNYEGSQISGFINTTGKIKGNQVGFININDSIEGLPIGFFSFSRKGYHQLEVSTNEVLPFQLAFKTGTHQFYNSFIGGVRIEKNHTPVYAAGYGLGSSVLLKGKSRLFFDLQAIGLQKSNSTNLSLLNKFGVTYQYQMKDKFAIAVGPSFNVLVTEDANTNPLTSVAPYSFYSNNTSGNQNIKMWVGGTLSFNFF